MTTPQRVIAVNLGMQTVGMAVFRPLGGGGLALRGFKLVELSPDPASEGARVAQIRLALEEIAAGLHLARGHVNFALPAQSVFTRFVKLPPVGESKVEQIIKFEAQQNVPFAIDEVVWDYQLVGPGGDRVEVVLVAIKADSLDDINGAVEGAGLRTHTVDVSPLALYNAYRYSYGEAEGCSLVIDIGARTTNLIFSEPGKLFTRSILIGGATLTANIAKDFDEPFPVAEERKRKSGFVGLGGTYAEPSDPEVARVSKVARNTMTRLHAEIARSISFYRSQQQGHPPDRVYLCGGGATLPYTREFFREKLGVPVEFFNPLRNVVVTAGVDAEEAGRSAHVLGELVGLALRAANECPVELNLRPASAIRAAAATRRRPFLALAAACVLLAIAGWWLYFLRAETVMAAVKQEIAPQVAELQRYDAKIKHATRGLQRAQTLAAPLLEAVEQRQFWPHLLEEINRCEPERGLWVTLMEPMAVARPVPAEEPAAGGPATMGRPRQSPAGRAPKSPPSPGHRPEAGGGRPGEGGGGAADAGEGVAGLRLKGFYLDNPRQAQVVDDFARELEKSPMVAKVATAVRGTPDGSNWAYDFELHLELVPAAAAAAPPPEAPRPGLRPQGGGR